MRCKTHPLPILFLILLTHLQAMSQTESVQWSEFPALPDKLGFAGMYAGVSSGAILAMGGANFPGKLPWEGGTKKWYDHIFVLPPGGSWQLSPVRLPAASGYGVSVSWRDKVIVAGGCNESAHLADVYSYEWKYGRMVTEPLPDLPRPLAYMTGALLGDILVVLGGSEAPAGPPTKTAWILNLENPEEGWKEIEPWPGPERILPVSGVWKDQLFLMSGETSRQNSAGAKLRAILCDNYALSLSKTSDGLKAIWTKRTPAPRGMSAGGTLPLLGSNKFFIWGGVDAVTAQYRTPATHPGITRSMLFYYPENDTWEYLGDQTRHASRVTLPVIPYETSWLYVSGEIKPGIRTPGIIRIHGK